MGVAWRGSFLIGTIQIKSEPTGKRGTRFRIHRFGVDSIGRSSIGEFGRFQARIWLILGWFLVFCVFRGLWRNFLILIITSGMRDVSAVGHWAVRVWRSLWKSSYSCSIVFMVGMVAGVWVGGKGQNGPSTGSG